MKKNNGVFIEYGNLAVGAKEDFTAVTNSSQYETLEQLKKNINVKNYANPCEDYQVALDNSTVPIPQNAEKENIGFWSNEISNEEGRFERYIVLTLTSKDLYSSQGLTFTFDVDKQIYSTTMKIFWYRVTEEGEEKLAEGVFLPDSAKFVCDKYVENYNKIVIEFYTINMPHNRLKLTSIDYGFGTYWFGDELRNVRLNQETSIISSEIAISTADFTLDSKSNIQYSFYEKQPLKIYFDGKLKAKTFITSSKRKSKKMWEIRSEDYISILDGNDFYGDVYVKKNAKDLLIEIFDSAQVPYDIDGAFATETVTGHIPFTTCREALMQVAFAIGAMIITADSDKVKVVKKKDEISQTIKDERILVGQRVTQEEAITAVEISCHSYIEDTDGEFETLYDGAKDGVGDNILIKFKEPMHSLEVWYSSPTYLKEWSANYAIIKADDNTKIMGKKYLHQISTKIQEMPVKMITKKNNVAKIENATLVSAENVDNVLENCYNYFGNTSTFRSKIAERKYISGGEVARYGSVKYGLHKYGKKLPVEITYDSNIILGEKIRYKTEYLGEKEGRVVRQSYNLNGGIIIKDCVIK